MDMTLWNYFASLSRNLCGVCIAVKLSNSETTMHTPRKLSVSATCSASTLRLTWNS